jgi:hypothetical protein
MIADYFADDEIEKSFGKCGVETEFTCEISQPINWSASRAGSAGGNQADDFSGSSLLRV